MATYWGLAVQSAYCLLVPYDMFSECKYLIINLVFPTRSLESEFLSDCVFSGSLPTCTFSCQVSMKLIHLFCRRRFLKGFNIHNHGGCVGHVSWINYIHIGSPFL